MTKEQKKSETCKEVEFDLNLLRRTYDDGARDPDMWHKGLLCLVYRLMVVEANNEAGDVLLLIPRNRLVTLLEGQIPEDQFFSNMMYDLAEMLIQQNVVPHAVVKGDLEPTQSPGRA